MNMQLSSIVRGALTFIPGIERLAPGIGMGTGGTDSAAYCYGVWMKHLALLHRNGMDAVPDTVAELGPGDSLGIGLAAMLSGANHYYALDVVEHADREHNLAIFDQLLQMFQQRAPRPTKGWPDFDDALDDQLFPSQVLTPQRLEQALAPQRTSSIRSALAGETPVRRDISIRYMVPWFDERVMERDSAGLIVSHSVLEHVVDLEGTYRAMHAWLRPGAWMSHQIDFKCHGLSREWNGYRQYPEALWKLVVGKRPYLLNRQPRSVHEQLWRRNGFELVAELRQTIRDRGLSRAQLSSRWRDISDEDLACSGVFVQARKRC